MQHVIIISFTLSDFLSILSSLPSASLQRLLCFPPRTVSTISDDHSVFVLHSQQMLRINKPVIWRRCHCEHSNYLPDLVIVIVEIRAFSSFATFSLDFDSMRDYFSRSSQPFQLLFNFVQFFLLVRVIFIAINLLSSALYFCL